MHDVRRRYPVELHDPTLAPMPAVAVERRIGTPERHHRPGERRNLGHEIVEIVGPAQQAQPSTGSSQTGFM